MDIDKIKKAIRTGCSYCTKESNGTIDVVTSPNSYASRITLTVEEYKLFKTASYITTEEKLERLEKILSERAE